MPTPPSRTIFRLGFDCNNACVFCGQLDHAGALEIDRAALEATRREHAALTIVGGEPSLDARLLELVELACELGFTDIGLQTNAQFMAEDPELLTRLYDAGLTDLHLSIHAATAEGHDYLTGRVGAFDHCIAALAAAARLGIATVVTTVATRSNFRELLSLPPLLKRSGVAAWLIDFVRPYGRAADGFARVVPRFGMALPWALHALQQSRRNALPAWIRGAPLCGLGPFASLALPEASRSYAAACEGCPARARCPGVDPSYFTVFGHSELRPVEAKPAKSFEARHRHLMAMFVGPGELVELAPRLYTVKAKRDDAGKHRRLPVLANTDMPAPDST